MKKCEQEIAGHCYMAITYKKYAEVRDCEKCCLKCEEPCGNMCDKALKINMEGAYE